jgi:hypothetical protein
MEGEICYKGLVEGGKGIALSPSSYLEIPLNSPFFKGGHFALPVSFFAVVTIK